MYLDIDQQKSIFIIRDTFTQRVLHEIPCWLMKYKAEDAVEVVHRFKWEDNKSLRVVNNEGFERLVRLDAQFSEIQFHSIPMYMSYWCTFNHYYYDRPPVDIGNVLERLKRKYQGYKCVTLMNDPKDFPDEKKKLKKLYGELFTVDYQNTNEDGAFERYVIDQSFTFLHWNLAEQLEQGALQVDKINIEQLKCLIYNIFPGGETILHKLKDNSHAMEKIYEQCHFYSDEEKKWKFKHHLPFVWNFNGQSPMDLLAEKSDMRNMDKMLLHLSPYGPDHHSREIQHLFASFVSSGLPSLNTYLKSRILQTKYLRKIDKGVI